VLSRLTVFGCQFVPQDTLIPEATMPVYVVKTRSGQCVGYVDGTHGLRNICGSIIVSSQSTVSVGSCTSP
jgi:hypothetical protein